MLAEWLSFGSCGKLTHPMKQCCMPAVLWIWQAKWTTNMRTNWLKDFYKSSATIYMSCGMFEGRWSELRCTRSPTHYILPYNLQKKQSFITKSPRLSNHWNNLWNSYYCHYYNQYYYHCYHVWQLCKSITVISKVRFTCCALHRFYWSAVCNFTKPTLSPLFRMPAAQGQFCWSLLTDCIIV